MFFLCEKPAYEKQVEGNVGDSITIPTDFPAAFTMESWTNGEGNVVATIPVGGVQLSPKGLDIALTKSGNDYQIASSNDLVTLQAFVAAGFDCAGKTFKQTANIDMAGLLWTGIGNKDGTLYFAGTYDGNGKKIENVTFDAAQKSYMGFFRYVKGGTIKDLTVETDGFGNVPDATEVGFGGDNYEYGGAAIVGIAMNSTLSGLTAKGQLGTQDKPTTHNIGGVAVEMLGGTIANCTNYVGGYCAYSKVGGIVVFTRNGTPVNPTTIENCVNYGNFNGITCYVKDGKRVVKGTDGAKVFKAIASDGYAGIIGWVGNDGGLTNIIINCENKGTFTVDQDAIDAGTAYLGGIIGEISGVVEGSGNTCDAALPLVGTLENASRTWTDFWYESIDGEVATQDKSALAAGQTRVIAIGSRKSGTDGLPKPVLELAAGQDITFITNLCVTALDFSGIKAADGAELGSEVVAGGVKFTATALPPPGPTPVDPSEGKVEPDPTEANTYIVTPGDGKTSVELQGTDSSMTIKVTSAADFTIAGLNGATVKVVGANGADITAYVKGGTAPFDTALSDAAKATLVTESEDDKPLVIGDNVDVTINTVNGLKYQLIRGTEVGTIETAIGEPKLGDGKPLTLTDADKPAGKAFYVIQTSK